MEFHFRRRGIVDFYPDRFEIPEHLKTRCAVLEGKWVFNTSADRTSAQVIIPIATLVNNVFAETFMDTLSNKWRIHDYEIIYKECCLRIKKSEINKSSMAVGGVNPMDPRILSLEVKGNGKKRVCFTITGVPMKKGYNGFIEFLSFSDKFIPGQLKKDGSMNYREIGSFPSVKAGEKLLKVHAERPGADGIDFDGRFRPHQIAIPFSLLSKKGVKGKAFPKGSSGNGYYVIATTDGIISCHKNANGKITEISVINRLEINEIGYGTGNIGTQFVCPAVLNIREIGNKFVVKSTKDVTCYRLNSGSIITGMSAFVSDIKKGSTVNAMQIQSNKVFGATLTAEKVEITESVYDSTVNASELNIQGKEKAGSFQPTDIINLTAVVNRVSAINSRVRSSSVFILGEKLFTAQKKSMETVTAYNPRVTRNKADKGETDNQLEIAIAKITPLINETKMKQFNRFITRIEQLPPATFEQILFSFQEGSNYKRIFQLRDAFNAWKKRVDKLEENQAILKEAQTTLSDAKLSIKRIRFSFEGVIQKGGGITIKCADSIPKRHMAGLNGFLKVKVTYAYENGQLVEK
jgi:hypothetical protein